MGCNRKFPWDVACPGGVRRTFCSLTRINSFFHSRFPVVSGLRISWDTRRQPGERVIGIWLLLEEENGRNNENGVHLNLEPVLRVKGGRKYRIVTREYMVDGHDGYEALRGSRQLIDHECGELMSSIVRRYLLGECDNFNL